MDPARNEIDKEGWKLDLDRVRRMLRAPIPFMLLHQEPILLGWVPLVSLLAQIWHDSMSTQGLRPENGLPGTAAAPP